MQHCLLKKKKSRSLCSCVSSIVRLSSILRIRWCFLDVINFSRRSAKNGFARLGSDPDLFCFAKKSVSNKRRNIFGNKEPKQFLKTCLAVILESFCVTSKSVTFEGALCRFVTYQTNPGAQPQVKYTQWNSLSSHCRFCRLLHRSPQKYNMTQNM